MISIVWAYLTTPRLYAPRWYHEGIAVCMETWMAGGIGRTLTGYDEMTFRAMVRDSIEFYTVVGLEWASEEDYGGETSDTVTAQLAVAF